jgi:glycosyltransferase involved in cell wall biosynthesis
MGLYRYALALVYPSYFGPENFPPLEAFAMGCPVIAADVEGARQQLGDAALLVPPDDWKLWGEAIARLYRDSHLRSRLVEAGRVRAASYTSRHYVADVLRFLDKFESIRRCWPGGV